MSQPNLPNITPNITLTRDDAVNLVLSSIAMEEMGMSHILNAEGEKLQYVLGTLPGLTGSPATISDLLAVNTSVKDMVNAITKNEYVLQQKLEAVTSIPLSVGPPGPTGPQGPPGELIVGDSLFYVAGDTNNVPLNYEEVLRFESTTLDISIDQGATGGVVVTIEDHEPNGFQEYGGYFLSSTIQELENNALIEINTTAANSGNIVLSNGEVVLTPGIYTIDYSLMSGKSCVVEIRDNNVSLLNTRIGSNYGITASNSIVYKVNPNTTSHIGLYFLGVNPNPSGAEVVEILYANITVTRIY